MAKILRILAVLTSCGFCAGLIWCSNIQNQTGIYVCIGGCLLGFLANMMVTAHENAKELEAQQKQAEEEAAAEAQHTSEA